MAVVASIGLVLAIPFGACVCWLYAAENDGWSVSSPHYSPYGFLVLALFVAGVLRLFVDAFRHSDHAAVPLPGLRPDPTAHYRAEPPLECPYHPSELSTLAPPAPGHRPPGADGHSGWGPRRG